MFSKSGDTEFTYMISRGYEENQNRLLLENQELRTSFELLQRELCEMMKQRRDAFHRRRKAELGEGYQEVDFSEHDIIQMKPDVFAMPFSGVSEEVNRIFAENMERFKSYMDKEKEVTSDIDLLAEDAGEDDTDKISSVNELKKLLKNYKVMVYNQQNLLQKSILGSQKIKAPEPINYPGSRL